MKHTPKENEDRMDIEINQKQYPYKGIDGIEISRNKITGPGFDTLGRIKYTEKDTNGSYYFQDKTGIPEAIYTYYISAYSIRNGMEYTHQVGKISSVIDTFPKLSEPYAVKAVDENGLYRTISWKHNRKDICG